jgi:hypothetical protein
LKKTASPRFLIRGFSVGLRSNGEAGTWKALKALGPRELIFPPHPPCPKISRRKKNQLKVLREDCLFEKRKILKTEEAVSRLIVGTTI